MPAYFCIVNRPGRPECEIHGLPANDDGDAMAAARAVAAAWPGYETVIAYDGERVVGVVANSGLGLPDDGLVAA